MRIRPETEADQAAIRDLNEQAFGQEEEADLVDLIRASDRRFGFVRADAGGIEAPPSVPGPQYFMLRELAAYDPKVWGRAVYPPETFGAF